MSTPGLPSDELKPGLLVDDYAESKETTGTVTVGGTATGEIQSTRHVPEPGWVTVDHDWFAVELVAGKTYRIELRGADTEDGTLANPRLFGIYDANGWFIGKTGDDNAGVGLNSRTIFEPGSSGTYYISAAGDGNGTYTLSVDEVTLSDDYAASVSTTGTVAVGGTATGGIDKPGDHDWFAVELEAGKTYVIFAKGADTKDGTLPDPRLAGVYDAGGDFAGGGYFDDSLGGRNSFGSLEVATTGTYYVSVGAYRNNTGTYTVMVDEFPPKPKSPDDYVASVATTGTVAVGGSVTGEIETRGDHDWFSVELEAGKAYVIHVKGADTKDGTLPDPQLIGVYDSSGSLMAGTGDDDGGSGKNSKGAFAPDTSGTYYVAVQSFGGISANWGTYKVTVEEEVAGDDEGTAQEAPADGGDVFLGSIGETGGTMAADTMDGTSGADAMRFLDGDDTARGLGGDDRLWGGLGADTLYGNAGDDRLWGGLGADTLHGNAGDDRLWGGRGRDELHGGVGKDHLYGNAGDDTLHGGVGKDHLYGGRGDDTLHGGRLADELRGGRGDDILSGGHGRDVFVYDDADFGRDRIVDFEDGTDLLRFTGSGLQWSDLTVSNNGKGHAVVRVEGAESRIVLEGVDASLIGQDDFIF